MPAEFFASKVELERLQALVDTQRRHIAELNKHLQETLDSKQQQQLQLVQQSPASSNVRCLLAQAAADNTALATKVEQLRSQRNALAVTKAALTAQLSELIRTAADEKQRSSQHEQLLQQLRELTRVMGNDDLQSPDQQIAAAVAYVQQAQAQQQQVHANQLQNDTSATAADASVPDAIAPDGDPAPGTTAAIGADAVVSPIGQRLDQTAISQLVWESSYAEMFQPQLVPADEQMCSKVSSLYRAPNKSGSTACVAASAPYEVTSGNSTSARASKPCLADLSYMSPLRTIASGNRPMSAVHQADVHDSNGMIDTADFGSPLSCQSLSMFSPSLATPDSEVTSRRLDLSAPATGKVTQTSSNKANPDSIKTPAAGRQLQPLDHKMQRDQQGSSSVASAPSTLAGFPAVGSAAESPLLLMFSPVLGISMQDLELCPSTAPNKGTGGDAGSRARAESNGTAVANVAICQQQGGKVGLRLEPEFQLAACDSIWQSPTVAADSSAFCRYPVVAGSHGACKGSWPCQLTQSLVPSRALMCDFAEAADDVTAGSGGSAGIVGNSRATADKEGSQGRQQYGKGLFPAVLLLGLPLYVAAVAVAAASNSGHVPWRLKRNDVEHVMQIGQQGFVALVYLIKSRSRSAWVHCKSKVAAKSRVRPAQRHRNEPDLRACNTDAVTAAIESSSSASNDRMRG